MLSFVKRLFYYHYITVIDTQEKGTEKRKLINEEVRSITPHEDVMRFWLSVFPGRVIRKNPQ